MVVLSPLDILMNGKHISFLGNQFYYWRLNCFDEAITPELQEKLKEVEERFITIFFQITRGKPETVESEFTALLDTISYLIPNLKLETSSHKSNLVNIFNSFHFEVMNSQSEKGLEILKKVKSIYNFSDVHKRFLIPDLQLPVEEELFLKEIFELKEFRSEVIAKKFIARFENFIQGFNENVKREINDLVIRTEEEFIYSTNILVGVTKRNIFEVFRAMYSEIKMQRVIISFLAIEPKRNQEAEMWTTVFENIYSREKIKIKQVVNTGESSVIISLAFDDSNQILLIVVDNFRSFGISALITDKTSLIAAGSRRDCIVLAKNTEIRGVMGHINDHGEFIEDKAIDLYRTFNSKINSLCYSKTLQEVLYINNEGKFMNRALRNEPPKDIKHLLSKVFTSIDISQTDDFILLHQGNEFCLLDSNLTLIYSYGRKPIYAALYSGTLKILQLDEEGISIREIRVYSPEVNKNSFEFLKNNAENNALRTISLGMKLVTDIFKNENYIIQRPVVTSTNLGNTPEIVFKKVIIIQRVFRRWRARRYRESRSN